MKAKDVYEALQAIAPEYMAEDWDHVGLLCGHFDIDVQRVLVALDPFMNVAREAVEKGCQIVVTHHPCLWDLKAVNDATPEGSTILYMIEHGITAINAHTNLDMAPGGVNDQLAQILSLKNIRVIDPAGKDAQGKSYGLLRGGDCTPSEPEEFVRTVREKLNCPGVRFSTAGRRIQRVAVGGGSCSGELARVAQLGYDAFVTADVKYNAFVDARAYGMTLIDAGHFETENPVVSYLARCLSKALPDVEVLISETHEDCIRFA